MKTTKEYPATHSMSTSWYVVDKDGNLGIFDYNENGPVPWQTEQTGIDSLIFGHVEKYYNEEISFGLTVEQILELVESPISPQEVKEWYWYYIVRIDKQKEFEFLKLCKSKDIDESYCVNKENGFYYFDAYGSIEEDTIRKESALQKMIDQNIILEVFKLKNFFIDEDYDEKSQKYIPHSHFGNIPYFIFRQQYSTKFLADRLNIPEHPVKISQIPEIFRHRIHRIPKSFYETKSLQIAQWIPSTSYEKCVYYDGCLYNLLPISESENAYCLCEILANDFYPYCPRKSMYNCDKCYTFRECIGIWKNLYTSTPTVVVVRHPKEEVSYDKNVKTDIITSNSVVISVFPYFPKRQKNAFWIDTKEELQKVSSEAIETVWKQSYHYFESLINEVKPHVIIIVTNKGQKLFEKVFKIENHSTEINGVTYPVYLEMEQEQYRAEIEKLAVMPYQGKKYEMVISEEKMNALIEEDKAKHD